MELNAEQSKLIEAEPGGPALIKGVAGSGKTTIALHRALFLDQKYCQNDQDRILLVTYNRNLINYLKHIYGKVDKKYRSSYSDLFSKNKKNVDIDTVDRLMYHQYFAITDDEQLEPLYASAKSRELLKDCISEIKKYYEDVPLIDDSNTRFLMDEIDWIKSCNYMKVETYQKVDRTGRARTDNKEAPRRLAKNSKAREAIFELMKQFYRYQLENGYIYHKNMALKVYYHALKNPQKKYKHIIIDEGQDLTRVQLEYLKTLYRGDKDSSFIFVADTAQSIYSHAWLVKGRNFTSLGIDMSGRSSILTKNYRTSTQIAQAAYSMIEKDSEIIGCEDYVPPTLIDRQGQYPVLKTFKSEKAEAESVLLSVKNLLAQGYSYKDIAIIARMKKQLECIKSVFDKSGIPCKVSTSSGNFFNKNQIQMMTIHAIKGLEYKVVFIIGLNSDVIPYFPDQEQESKAIQETSERKLLYVGMTRSREQLFLSCWGSPSKFIKDINPKFLRTGLASKKRSFYKINVDDYLFKDKLSQLYSREEEVRQWMLRELIDNYRYPEKLIELEQKVSLFSKRGSVDIAVNAYQDDLYLLSPIIFIETKAPGSDLAKGMGQLKSYMKVSPTCQYGVLTDGHNFIVLNRNYEEIADIPLFHQSMLPDGGDIYQFKDLKTKREYTVKVDYDAPDRVMVAGDETHEEYSGPNVQKLPIFHRVAAGNSHLMDEQVQGYFSLPARWFNSKKNVFILKVKGDSMVDADIDDGDLVVVEKKESAGNRDIVVVSFGDEAVVKRYSPMKETVLLLSENEKYEPIHVKTEQALIIGVVLGVIKSKKR